MTKLQTFKNGPLVNALNPVPAEYQFLVSTKPHFGTTTTYKGSYTTHSDASEVVLYSLYIARVYTFIDCFILL